MSALSPSNSESLAAPDEARRLGPYLCKELLDSLREDGVKEFDIGKTTGAATGEAEQVQIPFGFVRP